jgi:hypothetical protein
MLSQNGKYILQKLSKKKIRNNKLLVCRWQCRDVQISSARTFEDNGGVSPEFDLGFGKFAILPFAWCPHPIAF